MVSIPAHPEAEGRLQGDVLTRQTDGDERGGGVREGHSQSVHLGEEKNIKTGLNRTTGS